MQLIQQSIKDQLASQAEVIPRKRSYDPDDCPVSHSSPKRTKPDDEVLPLAPEDVSKFIYDVTSCPSPSSVTDPDEAAKVSPDGQLLLPHHPSVRKAIDNTNVALASWDVPQVHCLYVPSYAGTFVRSQACCP